MRIQIAFAILGVFFAAPAHAYDAVKMIVLAIERAGLDGVDMKSYINIMNPYPGVTGSTDFDDNGDVRKFHTMYGIQEGAAVRLE